MRSWRLRAPWWSFTLLNGIFLGAVLAAVNRFAWGSPWESALMSGLVSGGTYGAFLGLFPGLNRHLHAAAGAPSADRLIGMERSGRREAIEADPELRTAVRRVAVYHRDQLLRQRLWAIPFLLLMVVLTVRFALDRSPGYWVGTLFFTAALVAHELVPRRLERRAQELDAPRRDPARGAGMLDP